jgi:hypothetical protein
MENAREIKSRFERIAKGYNPETLRGYISFFLENWINRKNRSYTTRLNSLRLRVYQRVLKGLNNEQE